MNSITKLFDKYKTFEDKLKQERFWLFVPVYLVKTCIKYILVIFITILITIFFTILVTLILGDQNENYITTIMLFCFLLSPSITYILLFSRKAFTVHPFIISLVIYFFIVFENLYPTYNVIIDISALIILFVPVLFIVISHLIILKLIKLKKFKIFLF